MSLGPDDMITVHFDGFVTLKVSQALPDGLPEGIGPEITVETIAHAIKAVHLSAENFIDEWYPGRRHRHHHHPPRQRPDLLGPGSVELGPGSPGSGC
jgi:hypothetical protein